MSAADNREVLRGFYDAMNRRDLDAAGDAVGEGIVSNLIDEPGRDAFMRYLEMNLEAFPDLRYEVLDAVGENGWVAARCRIVGTHQGDFMDIPASGNTVDLEGADFVRVDADGKVVEFWSYADNLVLMQQLGAIDG